MSLLKFTKSKLGALARKIKSADKILKFIFIAGVAGFAIGLYLFKFELLSTLSIRELQRLETVTSLHNLVANPSELFNGLLQYLSLKAFPAHHIFALRMPVAIMVLSSIGFMAAALYIRFRNRYLPYTYLVFAITSPWLLLLAHQSYLPGIDFAFFTSLLLLSFLAVTSTSLRARRKKLFFLAGVLSLVSITLQPFGIPLAILFLILLSRSVELKYQIIGFGKMTKLLAICLGLIPLAINVFVSIKNPHFIQITTGFEAIKHPRILTDRILDVTKSIFGFDQTGSLSSGTNRPDFLLIGALSLTIYEAFKKRRARLFLLIGFASSIVVAGFYVYPGAFILPALLVPAIIGLAIANMVNIIDIAFPFNPYPRNIAKVAILLLITAIASLGLYTFTSATVRQNTPQKLDLTLQKE